MRYRVCMCTFVSNIFTYLHDGGNMKILLFCDLLSTDFENFLENLYDIILIKSAEIVYVLNSEMPELIH